MFGRPQREFWRQSRAHRRTGEQAQSMLDLVEWCEKTVNPNTSAYRFFRGCNAFQWVTLRSRLESSDFLIPEADIAKAHRARQTLLHTLSALMKFMRCFTMLHIFKWANMRCSLCSYSSMSFCRSQLEQAVANVNTALGSVLFLRCFLLRKMQCVPLILSKVLIPCTLEMEEEHEQAKRPVHVPPTEHLYILYTTNQLNTSSKSQTSCSFCHVYIFICDWLCHERWLFGESLWAQRCPGLFHNLRDGTTLEPYILTLAHWTEVAIRTAARKITDTVFVLGSSRILHRLVCFPAIACPSVQLQFYPVLFPHLSLGQCTSFSAVWQFLLSWAQLFELLFSDAWTRILRFASLASCCCPSWHSSTGKQIKSLCGRDLSGCPATGSVLTWAMKDTLVGWVI